MGDYLGTPGVVGFCSFPTPSPAIPSLQTSTFSHHTSKSTPLANPISKVSPPARPTHPPTYTSTPPPVPSSKAHSSTNLRRHWLHPPPPHSSPQNTNTNHFTEQSKYPIIQPHFHLNLSRKKKKKKIFFTRSPSPLGYQRQRVKYTRLFSFSSNGRQKIFPLSELISPTGISPVPTIRAALFSQRANYPFPRKGQPSDRNG